jgi:hypothetical protein
MVTAVSSDPLRVGSAPCGLLLVEPRTDANGMNLEAFATTGSWESPSEIEPKSDRDAPRVIRKDDRSGSFIIKSSAMVGYRIKQEKCAMDSAKLPVIEAVGILRFYRLIRLPSI